jgi:hypothetical protein
MEQTPTIDLTLVVQARCNVTGQIYEYTDVAPVPAAQKKTIVPPGMQLTNCPTGDGTGTTIGQIAYLENGSVVDSVLYDKLWVIHYTGCLINEQEVGSDTEYMSSTVYFLARKLDQQNDTEPLELSCNVRQPYSGDLPFVDVPLEVFKPVALQGQVDTEDFRTSVEGYYRYLVGPTGIGMRISTVARDISMSNINIQAPSNDMVKSAE